MIDFLGPYALLPKIAKKAKISIQGNSGSMVDPYVKPHVKPGYLNDRSFETLSFHKDIFILFHSHFFELCSKKHDTSDRQMGT